MAKPTPRSLSRADRMRRWGVTGIIIVLLSLSMTACSRFVPSLPIPDWGKSLQTLVNTLQGRVGQNTRDIDQVKQETAALKTGQEGLDKRVTALEKGQPPANQQNGQNNNQQQSPIDPLQQLLNGQNPGQGQSSGEQGSTGVVDPISELVAAKTAITTLEGRLGQLEQKVTQLNDQVLQTVTPAGVSWAKVYEKVHPAVVTVLTPNGRATGVIMDATGLVLTGRTIVNNVDNVVLRYHDGRTVSAVKVGSDADAEIAWVRIMDQGGMPAPVTVGNEEQLKIGDPVSVIGNPGLTGQLLTEAISTGHLTGRQRIVGAANGYPVFQFDAVIGPLSAGGPLVNPKGEVVGIAFWNSERARENYALPISIIQRLLTMQSTRLVRSHIGVSVAEGLTGMNAIGAEGTINVIAVGTGTPAAGKIPIGATLLSINGKKIESLATIREEVDWVPAGVTIPITYQLKGQGATTVNLQLDPVFVFDDKTSFYLEGVPGTRF